MMSCVVSVVCTVQWALYPRDTRASAHKSLQTGLISVWRLEFFSTDIHIHNIARKRLHAPSPYRKGQLAFLTHLNTLSNRKLPKPTAPYSNLTFPEGWTVSPHRSYTPPETLEPQACGGSVTRQSRRQFSRDIFLSCLSDQSNIACLMIIRGVLHPIFHSFLFFCIFFTVNNTILGDMIERLDVTHLL